jgi:chromosome segregation ATPase
MAEEEKKDVEASLKSIRAVSEKILEAMGRLKEQVASFDNRIKVLEVEIPGLTERQANLEKVIHMLMEGADDNLKKFLEKAAAEPGDEAETPEDGASVTSLPTGGGGDSEDPPPSEVAG